MNNTIISAREEQFRKECKVINLTYEYPGYTGIEQWAIITDLSEEELCAKYAEQVATFRPFVVLSSAFGKVRDTYIRNEHKHEMRRKLYGDVYSAEDGIEAYHPELIENDLLETIVQKEEMDFIKVAINTLSELQKSRIVRYFFQEKTLQEIADEDKTSCAAVYYSIQCGIKNLKKFLEQT